VALAGCAWLALRPPCWLLPDRSARLFGIGMAVALVAGFVLASRQEVRGLAEAGTPRWWGTWPTGRSWWS